MGIGGTNLINQISKRFFRFAEDECKGSSELYEFLSLKIVEDEEILQLSSYAQKSQPVPNLLFGAVHYLLLQGKEHELREFYPSIVHHPKNLEAAFSPFKDFCLKNNEQIKEILQAKLVQTNEVRRSAYLYPAFCYIYEKVKKPIALIEIGTSAGLQLFWDKYRYSYQTKEVYGDPHSTVHITSEVKAEELPMLLKKAPPVSTRIGLDLHVIDVNDEEDYLWLKALIWPEHQQRRKLFRDAAHYVKESSPKLVEGDGISLLPEIVDKIESDSVICIFHTHVANQIPLEAKGKLMETLNNFGRTRDVFHLYNNMFDANLHLDYFINGIESNNTIGKTDGHGRWFEWQLE